MASRKPPTQWRAVNENSSSSSSGGGSSGKYHEKKDQQNRGFQRSQAPNRHHNAANNRAEGSTSKPVIQAEQRKPLAFVPYLPQDEEASDSSEAQEVADISNTLLSELLKMKPRDFWREVTTNKSLHRFLDGYLHFKKRWYDVDAKGGRVIVGDEQLSRRVFMVFLRMSSNRDPGAGPSDGLSPQEHAGVLLDKGLITLPKMLDICALYGHDNPDLTRKLVSDVFKAQPVYENDVSKAVPHFVSTIKALSDRSKEGVDRSSNSGGSKLKDELVEVVSFLYDAVAALDAFLEIYPPACRYLLPPEDSRSAEESLFSSIFVIHSLLPTLRKGFLGVGGSSDYEAYVKRLNPLLVQLSKRLISKGYVEEVMPPALKGRKLIEAMVALAGGDVMNTTTILHSLLQQDDFARTLQELSETGSILLDDDQYALMLSLLPDARQPVELDFQQPAASAAASVRQDDEAAAVRQSQIAQIKDLFPNYGDGFIYTCLEAYDGNPEVVIQHILEGTLHSDLVSLDVTMERPLPARTSRPEVKDKGKGKAEMEPPTPKKPSSSSSSWSAPQQQGRYVRRNPNTDDDVQKFFNIRDEASSKQTMQLAMLYDDEYDDSFDNFGTSVGDAGLEADTVVDLLSRKKKGSDDESKPKTDGLLPLPSKKAGYFMKDGKLYNYKVAGSVAVSSVEEAEALKKQEEDSIYGLGRGGNVPHRRQQPKQQQAAVAAAAEEEEENDEETEAADDAGSSGGSRKFRRDRAMHKHMASLRG